MFLNKALYKFFKTLELNLRNSYPFGFNNKSKTLFFPGCSLASSNPDLVNSVHTHLKEKDVDTGLWSACCGRPLSQFVDRKSGDQFQRSIIKKIKNEKIDKIITSCGNCFVEFKHIKKSVPKLEVISLYDILAENSWDTKKLTDWSVHHPCPARAENDFKKSFENLVSNSDISINESDEYPLSCCLTKSDHAREKIRKNRDKTFITYCAHCVKSFQKDIKTVHVLQLLFNDVTVWKKNRLVVQFLNYLKIKKSI